MWLAVMRAEFRSNLLVNKKPRKNLGKGSYKPKWIELVVEVVGKWLHGLWALIGGVSYWIPPS